MGDATVNVELCSNDDTSFNSKVNVDKASPHFGPETGYPDYEPNLPEASYPDYKPKNENADGWDFEEAAQPDEDGTRDMFPISTYEYTHEYDPYDNLLSKTCINKEGALSNCSSHVRTTLATTAGKTTHFVVTPMSRPPTNASAEIFSIVPLEIPKEDKANYKFHDIFNNSLDTISPDGVQQYDVYLNRVIQDISELNNTALNSENLPTNFDKTFTLSNRTATKTTEAPLPFLHELNHSSGYMAINPTGPKSNETLPLIHGINQTSIDNAGEETDGMIEEAESRDVDKPDVYFENEVEMGEGAGSKAEEVRLNGTSSRTDEVEQSREVETTKKAGADGNNSKMDAGHSFANNSREVKGSNSEKGEKKKESKRLMSSPWFLILTILFLFILACIILAVLR